VSETRDFPTEGLVCANEMMMKKTLKKDEEEEL
jgi:hypothetical protein